MFTGLIEATGLLKSHGSEHSLITVEVIKVGKYDKFLNEFLKDVKDGDSISINGVCLTVIQLDSTSQTFSVNLAPETLSRSNLGKLQVNDKVNLERSLSSTTRFGGHFVQGHVDTIASIVSKEKDQDSLRFAFRFESPLAPNSPSYSSYLIPKGYITIDGISLTLTNATQNDFSIMLIPHTQHLVTLTQKAVGDTVNIEFDMMVKTIVNVIENSLESNLERLIKKIMHENQKLDD
ncbi:hypothetical protein O181_078373 [Austropuccinia psidii MF-1]|uniref:Riboflavin synthase n=1 Tax=Austropuccinia psidii MF-1 TaxID=1389203 RepID=A0A9Q3IEL1_9BASI|nr:hypothetical protein [Austropuccinia psidii MF-1]